MSADSVNVIFTALITGAITAVGSSLLTIAGLRVQIKYLEQTDDRHEKAITRAHERIDGLQEQIGGN